MSSQSRHDIADAERLPADVRLCHKLLRESLARGVTSVELVGAGSLPVINRHLDGTWQPYMQIPPQGFAALVRCLKGMAEIGPDRTHGSGSIRVRLDGRDAELALTTARIGEGVELLTLRPADTAAAT